MRHIVLAALAAVLLPSALYAQDRQAEIERALAPVSERAREATMVVHWNDDFTYEVLQEGDNGLVCYDRSTENRRRPFDVQCTSSANLERVAQNRRFRAEAANRQEEQAMVQEAEANGTRAEAEYGSMWIVVAGQDRASAGTHTTILVPGATAESTGFPTERSAGTAYIMSVGTQGAHIMLPGR